MINPPCKADFAVFQKSHPPSNPGPFPNGSNLAQKTIIKMVRNACGYQTSVYFEGTHFNPYTFFKILYF